MVALTDVTSELPKFEPKDGRSYGCNIPVAEVRAVPDVIGDPQFGYRGVFESFDSPISKDDRITLVKAGYITDHDGPIIRSKPPRLGEHSDEILIEAGFSEEEIKSFRERGAV